MWVFFKNVSLFGSSQAFIVALNCITWWPLLTPWKMFSPYSIWHFTVKATNWKCERMHVCEFVEVFFFWISKCLLLFTYWDQATEDSEKEAAKMYHFCKRLNKQSVEWISLLSAMCNIIYDHCISECVASRVLLLNLNGSLCICQFMSSRPDFLWGSQCLSWSISTGPDCPVHIDTPEQRICCREGCTIYLKPSQH